MFQNTIKKLIKNPIFYFFAVSISGYIITVLRLLHTHGAAMDEMFGLAGYFSFGDMIMHLVYVNHPAEVYFASEQACFPPFAYLIYLFIQHILPTNGTPDMTYYRLIPSFMLLYIILMVILCGIFREQISKILGDKKYGFGIWLVLILSEPFWGSAIERGNSVFLALLFILCGLILKDSDSQWKKETALIFFAMSASLKIYPAVMGFVYLTEKRFKEAGRLILYGILFFFTPFLFFGGFGGFCRFLTNLTSVNRHEANIYTIGSTILLFYQKRFPGADVPAGLFTVCDILSVLFMLFALTMTVFCKEYWKKLLFLSSLMVIFVPSSYPYTTVYLAIPFLYFVRDIKENRMNCFYATFFGLIFTIMTLPCEWFIRLFDLSFAYGIRYVSLSVIILGVIADDFFKISTKCAPAPKRSERSHTDI